MAFKKGIKGFFEPKLQDRAMMFKRPQQDPPLSDAEFDKLFFAFHKTKGKDQRLLGYIAKQAISEYEDPDLNMYRGKKRKAQPKAWRP